VQFQDVVVGAGLGVADSTGAVKAPIRFPKIPMQARISTETNDVSEPADLHPTAEDTTQTITPAATVPFEPSGVRELGIAFEYLPSYNSSHLLTLPRKHTKNPFLFSNPSLLLGVKNTSLEYS
jgi:hypothetical protein